jgi:hypothetical protein
LAVSIAEQRSIVADNIKQDATDCATGTKDGSLGKAVKDALDAHINIAGTQIDTEKFFDSSSSCFSSLSQMNDLSFSIPTVGNMLSSAQRAVSRYIKKQVCSMAGEISSTVLNPLNSTIKSLSSVASFRTINGFTGNMGDLSFRTNPSSKDGTYTISENPFDMTQSIPVPYQPPAPNAPSTSSGTSVNTSGIGAASKTSLPTQTDTGASYAAPSAHLDVAPADSKKTSTDSNGGTSGRMGTVFD